MNLDTSLQQLLYLNQYSTTLQQGRIGHPQQQPVFRPTNQHPHPSVVAKGGGQLVQSTGTPRGVCLSSQNQNRNPNSGYNTVKSNLQSPEHAVGRACSDGGYSAGTPSQRMGGTPMGGQSMGGQLVQSTGGPRHQLFVDTGGQSPGSPRSEVIPLIHPSTRYANYTATSPRVFHAPTPSPNPNASNRTIYPGSGLMHTSPMASDHYTSPSSPYYAVGTTHTPNNANKKPQRRNSSYPTAATSKTLK